jgi:hypothetical protein
VRLPLTSTPTGSVRLLGFIGHCGHGKCWSPCPGVPPICIVLRERGPLPQNRQAPGRVRRSSITGQNLLFI